MQFTITVQHGPLSIEVEGDDRQEIQDEILNLAEFVGEHEDTLSRFAALYANSGTDDAKVSAQSSATGPEDSTSSTRANSSEFASLSQKTGVDEGILRQIFQLPDDDDDDEGVPSLDMYHFEDGTLTLGEHRNQRQAQASSLLLYAWEECIGDKEIKYDKLDESLTSSDIETERRDAMGQAFSDNAREWFESDGSNIYLVGKGKNHARELIKELAEQLQSQ
jgi:hypothetical protein